MRTAACFLAVVPFVPAIEQGWSSETTSTRQANMEERKLVYIGVGQHTGTVSLDVGQILQVEPFRYPMVPPFEDARLTVRLRGDLALHFVGQSPSPATKEGRGGANAFLYAIASGKCTVSISLVDGRGKAIEKYTADYSVVVGMRQ
jgi:hypothetical protein